MNHNPNLEAEVKRRAKAYGPRPGETARDRQRREAGIGEAQAAERGAFQVR